MTMVNTGVWCYPDAEYLPQNGNNAYGNGWATFDSSSDKIAVIFIAQKDITISDIWFLTGTITDGGDVTVSVESVSSGRPAGVWATGTSAAITITGATTWQQATLSTAATISAGNQFAIQIVDRGTDTHNGQYLTGLSASMVARTMPAWIHDATGSWIQITAAPYIIFGESGSPVAFDGTLPYSSVSNTGFDSADSPDEYAMRVVPPMKCRCIGAAVSLGNINVAADFKVFLWGNDGASDTESSALAEAELIDGNLSANNSTEGYWKVYWPTPVTLTAGSVYHIGVRAQTTTANGVGVLIMNMAGTSIPTGYINANPLGADCYLRTRTWSAIDPGTVGAWSDDTTKVPNFRLIIDQVDDGNGTGGGSFGRMIGG